MQDTKRKTLTPTAKARLDKVVEKYVTHCPTHELKLLKTRTTKQLVCPDYDCEYWRQE